MDNASFQSMPRFPLTPAEEALVPRPHASASQVATTLPSTYTRHGSTLQASLPSQIQQQHRPQYTRKTQENHPYSTNQGSRIFSFSFSSSSITNRNQQQLSPPSSPTTPTYNNPAFNGAETEEQEYPQNPQDSCHDYHSQLHSPIPICVPSPEPPTRKSFSLAPRPARPPSPQLYSDLYENTSYQRQYSLPFPPHRGSMDSNPRLGLPTLLTQGNQESWGSTIRMESPAPLSDSESSHSDTKETQNSDEPRQLSGKNILRRFQRLPDTTNTGQKGTIDATSQRRGSLESEHATRFSYESQREVIIKPSKSSNNLQDISDEERQETKRSKPTWRPSLPLIRQEGSSFNVLSMQDQRRYPQNDQHRISDTPAFNEPRRRKSNRQGKKKRKASSRKRKDQQLQYDSYSKGSKELPTLAEVLEKKSRFPLSYDDFEAFLKSQRAVEYLNFWADVTAHEQLCRTFNVSERRLKREYQLEERALARDRRRLTRPEYEMGNTSSAQDGSAQEQGAHNSRIRTGEQEMNNSNLYLTSRSSLQLPLHDHLSFPPEPRRYGIQDSVSQRRGSEQRATGAYNRLLAGAGARRSSLDASRQSLDEIPLDNDTTFMDAAPDGLRFQGRRPSIAVDYYGNGIKPSASQLSLPPQKHDQNMQGEIAQLAEAVEELIPPGRVGQYVDSSQARMSQQSLKIVEPIIHRKQSMVGTIGPLQSLSPLTPRRSGESAHAPSLYSTVHDGRPILAQSYRTISLEDLEESALRIYRKYLIQLRTSSMAREEEAAAANSAPNTTAIPTPVIDSAGRERILAPGWEGYAEQVIAEWNQRWKGRSAEARRARRLSNRRDTLGHGSHALDKKVAPGKDSSQSTANAATTDANNAGVGVNEKAELSEDEDEDLTVGENSVPGRGSKGRSTATHRPKLDRDTTATGITSFIARLLRTETTVLELPTLTVNTTTVVTDADSDGSEYDDDDFDSDDMEYEEDEGADVNNDRLEAPKMTFIQYTERPSIDNTVEGSTAGDPPLSETGSAIQLQQLVSRQPASEYSRPDGQIHRSQLQEKPRNTDPTLTLHSRSGTAPALLSSIPSPEAVAQSAAVAAFYLPLECRERIHTQIQQEKRIDGAHVFGPAKGFVVDVVLRDFYFPLFLNQVKKQNMGLLHRTHVNNRIKQRGMMVIGIALWMAVIALQVMLVMMAWGGWTSPWVWVVGIVGGWPGAICLATGMTGFSPILGLVHKIAEDRHVFRFRGIIEKSILTRHRRRAIWMMLSCLFWSVVASVIFAALPQQTA